MKKTLKVGVIGTGFGSMAHIPAFNQNKSCKIIAVFGRDKKKLKLIQKKYKIKKIYTNFNSILKNGEIDFFSVVVPPALHFRYVKKILEVGKNVLCEKPFTVNKKYSDKLIKISKKNKSTNFVSYQMRYQPIRQKIKSLIKNNKLGTILNAHLSFDYSSRLYSESKFNWWSLKKHGGGVLRALGSHQLDLLTWWFGKPKKVIALQTNFIKKRYNNKTKKYHKVNSDDITQLIISFEKFNCTISISSTAIGWKNSVMQIYGSKAALFLNGENNLVLIKKPKKNQQEKTKEINISIKENFFKYNWIKKSIWRAALLRQINNIVDHKLKNKKYLGASFQDGHNVNKIIYAAELSVQKKKFISIR